MMDFIVIISIFIAFFMVISSFWGVVVNISGKIRGDSRGWEDSTEEYKSPDNSGYYVTSEEYKDDLEKEEQEWEEQ